MFFFFLAGAGKLALLHMRELIDGKNIEETGKIYNFFPLLATIADWLFPGSGNK